MQIKNGKDFWAGLMYLGFGLGFAIVSQNYNMGTAVRMGPAYFPTMLGGLLAILGAVILARSFFSKVHHAIAVFPFRPVVFAAGCALCVLAYFLKGASPLLHTLALAAGLIVLNASVGPRSLWVILAGVVLFAFMLKPFGLMISTFALIFVAAYGGTEFKQKEVWIVGVVLVIFTVVVFVKGLGLPFNLCPEMLDDACRKIGLGQ